MTAAIPLLRRIAWWEQAACRGTDVDVFFPDAKGSIGKAIATPAAVRCIDCPVQAQCLAEALDLPRYLRRGIWGGWLWPSNGVAPPIDILHRAGFIPHVRTPP